jgi:hypothetical protein
MLNYASGRGKFELDLLEAKMQTNNACVMRRRDRKRERVRGGNREREGR